MIKRTIEVSREPAHIAVRDEQLLILRKNEQEARPRLPAHPPNLAGSIPCEDIGVLMVDSRDTTYSHHALAKLAEHGAALVICGRDHQPIGMFTPISTNTQLLARLDTQLNASKPTVKRLWQEIVAAKVAAQASLLAQICTPAAQQGASKLVSMARNVRSGDPDNTEAQAAARYWPLIFADCADVRGFRRIYADASAPPPNNLLDYGYATLRAAVARSIVSAGLLPALGVKHIGRSNPFCLADDLMEPLRPMVDRRVRALALQGELSLVQTTKAELLKVLTDDVATDGLAGPLLVQITRYVASFVRVLGGESRSLSMPIATWEEPPCV